MATRWVAVREDASSISQRLQDNTYKLWLAGTTFWVCVSVCVGVCVCAVGGGGYVCVCERERERER